MTRIAVRQSNAVVFWAFVVVSIQALNAAAVMLWLWSVRRSNRRK
jgi:hypothetical protein